MSAIWTVDRIEYLESAKGKSKVVNVVHWCAKDGDIELHATSTPIYTEGDPFTPYDQLTEADVIGWVKDVMGEDRVKEIETAVEAERQKIRDRYAKMQTDIDAASDVAMVKEVMN